MTSNNKWTSRAERRLLCWLAKGPVVVLILSGTVAMAGVSAAALTPVSSGHSHLTAPYNGYCGPDPDGDGHEMCFISPTP